MHDIKTITVNGHTSAIIGPDRVTIGGEVVLLKDLMKSRYSSWSRWSPSTAKILEAKMGLRTVNPDQHDVKGYLSMFDKYTVRKLEFGYNPGTISFAQLRPTPGIRIISMMKLHVNGEDYVKSLIGKYFGIVLNQLCKKYGETQPLDLVTNLELVFRETKSIISFNCGNSDCILNLTFASDPDEYAAFIEFFEESDTEVRAYLCANVENPETKITSTPTGKTYTGWSCFN